MAELIYGINPVCEGLQGRRRKPLEVLLAHGVRGPRIEQLLTEAERAGVPLREVPRRDLDRMAGHSHHQGVMLRVEPFAFADLDDLLAGWKNSDRPAFFLVLDGITDPYNFGALLRSADAAGCHGVIIARDRACPVTGVVDKASAGALEHIALAQVTNLSRTLEVLQQAGVWIYGLAGEAGSQPLFAADLCGDLALVVGSEGSGLRPNVRRHCDHLVGIPMHGGVGSLNASVAAGVALFEVVRQREAVGR